MTQARRADNRPERRERWFATFMFLDAGCAISSTQLDYIVGTVTAAWRRILGRPSPSRTLP